MKKGEIYKKKPNAPYPPLHSVIVYLRTKKGKLGNMVVLHYPLDGDRRQISITNHSNFLYHFYRYM